MVASSVGNPAHDNPTTNMNNQHTPGPWNLHSHYDGAPMAVERADGSAFVAWDLYIAHGDKIIADVIARTGDCGWPHVDNACELKANARIMVAAPVMLDELEHSALVFGEIIDAISDGDAQSAKHAAERALDTTRAAIAYAEGQS